MTNKKNKSKQELFSQKQPLLHRILYNNEFSKLEKCQIIDKLDLVDINDPVSGLSNTLDKECEKTLKFLLISTMVDVRWSNPSYFNLRHIEPIWDLKKGIGTRRRMPRYSKEELWKCAIDVKNKKRDKKELDNMYQNNDLNPSEYYYGEDLVSNDWIQKYSTYDYSQGFPDEKEWWGTTGKSVSIYTTNQVKINQLHNEQFGTRKSVDKNMMIMGIEILDGNDLNADFISIMRKSIKVIMVVSKSSIVDNKFMFNVPIYIGNEGDLDVRVGFTDNNLKPEDLNGLTDHIKIHGLVCETTGMRMMG